MIQTYRSPAAQAGGGRRAVHSDGQRARGNPLALNQKTWLKHDNVHMSPVESRLRRRMAPQLHPNPGTITAVHRPRGAMLQGLSTYLRFINAQHPIGCRWGSNSDRAGPRCPSGSVLSTPWSPTPRSGQGLGLPRGVSLLGFQEQHFAAPLVPATCACDSNIHRDVQSRAAPGLAWVMEGLQGCAGPQPCSALHSPVPLRSSAQPCTGL